ncbi:MAG: Tn3 family transposase [Gammaproteobacteria bacterium]|nr:Tn3 family transposase [Gammaproteobacteria bacterium]
MDFQRVRPLYSLLFMQQAPHQTKAINKLRSQGVDIPIEILTGIAPYWTEHINRFGAFHLNMDKMATKIEYDLQ